MRTLKFAPHIPDVSTTDMNEALRIATEDLQVAEVATLCSDIKVSDEGVFTIGNKHKDILLTKEAFVDFCSLLGIPKPFARSIPDDLLITNIRRLQELHSKGVSIFLNKDNVIVGCTDSANEEVQYDQVIEHFLDKDVKEITLGPQLMKITLMFENVVVDVPTRNEQLYTGSFIYHSAVQKLKLNMTTGLYRTQCTNSFLMPLVGKVKANYIGKVENRLLRFAEDVRIYNSDALDRLTLLLKERAELPLNVLEFQKLWNRFSLKFNSTTADNIFKVAEEDRKNILTEARETTRLIKQNQLDPTVTVNIPNTGLIFYDTINNVTAYAHEQFEGFDRFALEQAGGDILQSALLGKF